VPHMLTHTTGFLEAGLRETGLREGETDGLDGLAVDGRLEGE
jgi:hypothetical protein